MLWDWGWTWKSLDIENADYGIKMTGDYQGGSLLVLDSSMSNVGTGIYVTTPFVPTCSYYLPCTHKYPAALCLGNCLLACQIPLPTRRTNRINQTLDRERL